MNSPITNNLILIKLETTSKHKNAHCPSSDSRPASNSAYSRFNYSKGPEFGSAPKNELLLKMSFTSKSSFGQEGGSMAYSKNMGKSDLMGKIMDYIKSMMGMGGGNGGVHGGNNFPQQSFGSPGSGRPAGMTNKEIAKNLQNNFDYFEDPKKPGLISQERIRDIANRPLTGRFADDRNIQLAREILKRPDLNKLLDQHSKTGQLDGLIDRRNIEIAIDKSK